MKIKIDTEWTVGKLIDCERQQFLRVNHEYQRGLRWTEVQKQMFIDSIFRGYSIPAFYFHKREKAAHNLSATHLEIVDGQQRINAIYSYSEGAFSLLDPTEDLGSRFPNFVKDDLCPWGGKRFSELPEKLQTRFKDQGIVVYEITTDNEISIRDLFIRLQGGTPLTPQDRRDSWPGNFTEFVLKVGGKSGVEKWYGFPLFNEITKVGSGSRRRQLVAQIFMLFWSSRNMNRFCDIKTSNIDAFYHSQVGFDGSSTDAKRFEQICKRLEGALTGKPKISVGHLLIHLFLLTDALMEEFADGWEANLAESLFEFDERRKVTAKEVKNRIKPQDERYYSEYGRFTQTRSDDGVSIRRRHAFFTEEMLRLLSPVELDTKRSFSNLERKTVFFRDMESCQWCRMNGDTHRVVWEDCEIHHVKPYVVGGKTNILNAALVHKDCHPKKLKNVDKFKEWWFKLGMDYKSSINEPVAQ